MTDKPISIHDKLHDEINRLSKLIRRSKGPKGDRGQSGITVGGKPSLNKGEIVPRTRGKLLKLLAEEDNLLIKDIVEKLDIRPSTASELIAKTEKKGFVTVITDGDDKRAKRVSITAEGRKRIQDVREKRAANRKERLSGLTDVEQEQLLALLSKLNESLKEQAKRPQDDVR
jgi:DNA-binding MarR family transcriptional regulator